MNITFNENQTTAQVATALGGTYVKVGFSVVGPDTQYPTGSLSVLLQDAAGNLTGYRVPTASQAACKHYAATLISTYSLVAKFLDASTDDGTGTVWTEAQAGAW